MSYIDAGYAVVLAVIASYGALLVHRRHRLERLVAVAARRAAPDPRP